MGRLTGECMGCHVRGAYVFGRIEGCTCRTVGAKETNAGVRTSVPPPAAVKRAGRPRRRIRAGSPAVAALLARLASRGYQPVGDLNPAALVPARKILVREYAWALDAGRELRADVAFPALKVLVEVKGGAHAAGRQKQREDVEREALAVQLGYLLIPLTPEMAHDESGASLVLATVRRAEAAVALGGRAPLALQTLDATHDLD